MDLYLYDIFSTSFGKLQVHSLSQEGEFSRNYGAQIKKSKSLLKTNLEKELVDLSQNLTDENKVKCQVLKELQSQGLC